MQSEASVAEPARDWLILENLQARLQEILVSNDYRTNAGADVRLEAATTPPVQPMITLYSAGRTWPQDAKAKGEREFTLIAEARIPIGIGNAQAMAVAIDADIEQALDEYLPQPLALPLTFEESMVLDRPEGVAEIVVQQMYTTRYRR
jgi:hypothetical protein